MMRAIIIADDDSLVGKMQNESADLLISLGDIYDSTIERVQALYSCSTVLAVKGNHDYATEFPLPIIDLHGAVTQFGGLVFGGFGGSWKYKPWGHHLYEQSEVTDLLCSFPPVDVFVAHNSPWGIHERDRGVHQGFEAFRGYIERVQPKYFLHGHQHVNEISKIGATNVIGVFGEQLLVFTDS